MPRTSLTGKDAITINSSLGPRNLVDLADGDAVVLSFPNDLATVKAAKNGNIIYGQNEMGRLVEVSIRLITGSDDDAYMNSIMQEQKNDFSGFTLVTGTFVKRAGDGAGVISSVVYQLRGGIIKKDVEAKTNVEGDATQSVSVYYLTFASDRSFQ